MNYKIYIFIAAETIFVIFFFFYGRYFSFLLRCNAEISYLVIFIKTLHIASFTQCVVLTSTSFADTAVRKFCIKYELLKFVTNLKYKKSMNLEKRFVKQGQEKALSTILINLWKLLKTNLHIIQQDTYYSTRSFHY